MKFIATLMVLLVLPAYASETITEVSDLVLFNGEVVAPYELFVGDSKNWRHPLGSDSGQSVGKKVSVLPQEEGHIDVTWRGRGEGQLYLSAESADYSNYSEADGSLVMLLRVNQAPKRQAVLRMGCGYPCAGNADITGLLKALPKDEWLRVSIDLACFVKGGLDVTSVDTPFLLLTSGKMSLSMAEVRLMPNSKTSATVKC